MGVTLFISTYIAFHRVERYASIFPTEESHKDSQQIKIAIREKAHSFATSYTWQNYIQQMVKEEKIDRLKGIFHVSQNDKPSCHRGIVIIHNSKKVFASGYALPDKYLNLYTGKAKRLPEEVYTEHDGRNFLGIMSFKVCDQYGKNPLKDSAILLILNWKRFLRMHLPLTDITYTFSERKDKAAILSYPLRAVDGKVKGYINFVVNKEKIKGFTSYTDMAFTLSAVAALLLIIFSFIYIKRNYTITKNLLSILGSREGNVSLKAVAEQVGEIAATNNIYKEALKTAISTKSFKETMNAIAKTTGKIAECDMWFIISVTREEDSCWRIVSFSHINRINVEKVSNMLRENTLLPFKAALKENKTVITKLDKAVRIPLRSPEEEKAIYTNAVIPIVLNGETVAFLTLCWQKRTDISEAKRRILHKAKEIIELALKNTQEVYSMFQLSHTDPLLNIYNRRILTQLSEKRLNGSILFIDIDNFKQVNDTYGHDMGDKVLKKLIDLISGNLRKGDILLRFGGDEFVIYLDNIKEGTATIIKERIEKRVGELLKEFRISISTGIVEVTPESDIIEAIKEADRRMYIAKKVKQSEKQDINK